MRNEIYIFLLSVSFGKLFLYESIKWEELCVEVCGNVAWFLCRPYAQSPIEKRDPMAS